VFSSGKEIKFLQSIPDLGSLWEMYRGSMGLSGLSPTAVLSQELRNWAVRYGRMRKEVNRYLKWAFVEAANTVALMPKGGLKGIF